MARYLRTSSITAELETLIRNAREKLYIISPYLKLSDNIKELLNDKEREKVEVRIIFGKQELAPVEMSYLEGLSYVRLYFSRNLHAKCYLNENKMIIASMNLYEFSQQHNKEMGILIDNSNEDDRSVYEDAYKDITSILQNSEDFSYVKAPPKKAKEKKVFKKTTSRKSSGDGHCIRCGTTVKTDPMHPYCKKCFSSWSKFKNPDYEEKHCHICGNDHKGTINKPTCYKCYKKHKSDYTFPKVVAG